MYYDDTERRYIYIKIFSSSSTVKLVCLNIIFASVQ